ncbi:MAG: iron-containing alcohol dehydrogenase [Chloroflexi bacterium]|nr:iron-containing alcohol dehydrogenase [Chloroflexota bacterium]
MDRFLFRQPSFVTYGNGVAQLVGDEARSLGVTRALLVTDKGVRAAGLVDGILASLAAAGVTTVVYDNVGTNPETTMVEAALALLQENGAEGVVAVGGGSSMDTAKGVAFLATNGGKLRTISEGIPRWYPSRASVSLPPPVLRAKSPTTLCSPIRLRASSLVFRAPTVRPRVRWWIPR